MIWSNRWSTVSELHLHINTFCSLESFSLWDFAESVIFHSTTGASAEDEDVTAEPTPWCAVKAEQMWLVQDVGQLQCGCCSWGWQLVDNYCYLHCWQWAAALLLHFPHASIQRSNMTLEIRGWNVQVILKWDFLHFKSNQITDILW